MPDVEWLLQREAREGFVLVRLRLRATEEGGRQTPIATGYRACWDIGGTFEGEPMLNDAPLLLESDDWLEPGSETHARLHPLMWEFWADIAEGQRILMQEGNRLVGEATVVRRVPAQDG